MKSILVIEDDPAIVKGLRIGLEEEHYDVETATDGEKGYQLAQDKHYDIIILDLMLPGMNGQDICRELRSKGIQTPIIMLTSKKQETDKVLGLELGADDYVTKPFSILELQARIRAILRRSAPKKNNLSCCNFGSVELDFKKQTAFKNGQSLKLSTKEFEILHYFLQKEEEVVTRDMLLDEVWGYDVFPTTRTIDTFILNLRKKIEEDPSNPKHLITVHKAGYKFLR
jgi:DNA-binding response OmpR family regulator